MTAETPTIAIIGAGNMGGALIGGLLANNHPANKLWAADHSPEKLQHLEQQFSIHITTDNEKAVHEANVVILAVKPTIASTVAKQISQAVQAKKSLIISVITGIRESVLQEWLGDKIPIVRCMPNTPALIGCGASGLYANSQTSAAQRNLAESILRCVGITVWLEDENKIDMVTAVSGSGPAYFFLVMEAMQTAATELGLSEEMSRLLTLQTAYGAARLALESDKSITDLRHQVTSPGGTTEAALKVLESDIKTLFSKAIKAAHRRAEELGKTHESS